jgi:hypothetical protein
MMHSKLIRFSTFMAGVLSVASAFAQDTEATDESAEEAAEPAPATPAGAPHDDELVRGMKTNTGRGYGPAGCGLGSLIFEPNSGFTQVFAATTNGTFFSQTFGITSGTSNCVDTSGGTASAKAFIQTNRTAIAKDIARGQGETIKSLRRLGGCADDRAVGASLQKSFERVFPSAAMSDADVGNSVVGALRADTTLDCRSLI